LGRISRKVLNGSYPPEQGGTATRTLLGIVKCFEYERDDRLAQIEDELALLRADIQAAKTRGA
jgi:hypothetical protein